MKKPPLFNRLAWLVAPPAIALGMLASGADPDSISGTFLVACSVSYLLVPILRHGRRAG